MAIIFHIARSEAWASRDAGANREEQAAAGSYRPELLPVEGFVHCSTRDQVVKVADIRFRSQKGLVLLCIDTDKVTAEIRYENLEGGRELFPHIYGEINTDAVVQVAEFEPGVEGYFTLPAMLALQEEITR
jgi:uncharacterized protein (DUF952 family)